MLIKMLGKIYYASFDIHILMQSKLLPSLCSGLGDPGCGGDVWSDPKYLRKDSNRMG